MSLLRQKDINEDKKKKLNPEPGRGTYLCPSRGKRDINRDKKNPKPWTKAKGTEKRTENGGDVQIKNSTASQGSFEPPKVSKSRGRAPLLSQFWRLFRCEMLGCGDTERQSRPTNKGTSMLNTSFVGDIRCIISPQRGIIDRSERNDKKHKTL